MTDKIKAAVVKLTTTKIRIASGKLSYDKWLNQKRTGGEKA